MPTIQKSVYDKVLGEYSEKGFSIGREDDHTFELLFKGAFVARFGFHATIENIKNACCQYLNALETGTN